MMKRLNGPLYRLLSKLWDFEAPEGYPEHTDCPEDALPVCLNCLEPESEHQWICKQCGWPSSFYGTQMPYIKIFCLGAFFRSGVDGSVPLTKFRIIGLIFAALVHYNVFAPFYLYRLYQASRGNYIQQEPQHPETRRPDLDQTE
jgi:hypothetical protein